MQRKSYWKLLLGVGVLAAVGSMAWLSSGSAALDSGSKAPDFKLMDETGRAHKLSDYKGKWVVLAFYPADATPGCSMQMRSLRDAQEDLKGKDVVTFGISVQDKESKAAFCAAESLNFHLLADTEKSVSETYGVLNGVGLASRKTFIVDPAGYIARRVDDVNVRSHGMDISRMIASLTAEAPAPPAYRPRTAELKTLKPGEKAPVFNLPRADNSESISLEGLLKDRRYDGVALIWVSVDCPVSRDYESRMKDIAAKFSGKRVAFVGINSNSTESVAKTKEHFEKQKLGFPIVVDAENKVADAYGAMVTPEVFLIDKQGVIVYHGAIDDSRDKTGIKSTFLDAALADFTSGVAIKNNTSKAFGCTIKRVRRK